MSSFRNILVPTDFSGSAAAALERALVLAAKLGAETTVLHVYSVPPLPDGMGWGVGVDVVGPIERSASAALAELAARHSGRPGWGGALLRMGDPRSAILQRAEELPADLIVMGTHGRRGVQHLLLGSVAESVVRHASCPVLVVQAPRSPA